MVSIKKSRPLSFLVITVVYVLAALVGIAVYRALPYAPWIRLLLADIAATVLTFLFSALLCNASVYDPYWSVQPIVILIAFAIAEGLDFYRSLLLAVVCLWGVRLTANWAYTFADLEHQDWRYTMLHKKTGKFYPLINFVGIHMVPTLVVYGCILPPVFAFSSETSPNFASYAFLGLSLVAILLQGTADVQMHRFRRHRNGNFIRNGLWKHSRHPNYLGEVLMWWGVAGSVVCALPDAWYLVAGAFANTLLFLLVSIPMADGRQSRKEGFADYKAETRMLLPLPRFRRPTNG